MTATEALHGSDCAQHNEPAYPNGPCDCSARDRPVSSPSVGEEATRPETISEHIARDMREGRFPKRSEPQMVCADVIQNKASKEPADIQLGITPAAYEQWRAFEQSRKDREYELDRVTAELAKAREALNRARVAMCSDAGPTTGDLDAIEAALQHKDNQDGR